jgi:hypothetical protein
MSLITRQTHASMCQKRPSTCHWLHARHMSLITKTNVIEQLHWRHEERMKDKYQDTCVWVLRILVEKIIKKLSSRSPSRVPYRVIQVKTRTKTHWIPDISKSLFIQDISRLLMSWRKGEGHEPRHMSFKWRSKTIHSRNDCSQGMTAVVY